MWCVVVEKMLELGYRDDGLSCVVMPKLGNVLLSTGTGGIESISPRAKPYIYWDIIFSYLPLSKGI